MDEDKEVRFDCSEDPIGMLKRLFVDRVQIKRIRLGQNPALRPVFSKVHAVAHGWFNPLEELDGQLKVGAFALRHLPAWVRFSTDEQPSDPDLKSTCGVGIKLFGVAGSKLLGDGDTQDFILQNHDVFFVDNVTEMCEFTRAGLVGEGQSAYTKKHPNTARILRQMEKVEASVLAATYWSVLPYAFGEGCVVKYKLVPRLTDRAVPPNDDNYLTADAAARLRESDAIFDFFLQFQKDPMKQPVDRATVRWEEADSKPVHVAVLTLPRQDVHALGQANYGENLSFNPWHSLKEHSPLGSLAEARRAVYSASAEVRRATNGVPANEPGEPRPAVPLPQTISNKIVRAAIYPPIGIARVGNSQDENGFFYGPEVTEPEPRAPGFYRDAKGALKRQAARFRVFGLNAEGAVVEELNASNAVIRWSVHLANKKPAWFQFQLALDIEEASSAPPSLLRNGSVTDRSSLIIDSKQRHITGCNTQGGDAHTFDKGEFMGIPVYLGELRTDELGRLVVLGGRGISASVKGKAAKAITFANNEGWHDDVSDGPVTAEVTYDGQILPVDPGWVVVAPPNYAPNCKSVRTMWDLMRDTFIAAKMLPRPVRPSFKSDIRPIFERLTALQWVNAGFAASFGWKGNNNFSDPSTLSRLSANDPAAAEFRKTIANQFRVFARDSIAPQPWPWLWGDAMNEPPTYPRSFTALTDTQLQLLQQWAAGDFEADFPGGPPVQNVDDLAPQERADMLTRAAMEFCLADAFHPGCEMTWPMRLASMYMAPFRILHAEANTIEPSYAGPLTHDTVLLRTTGPCGPQFPGGLTRWLAVPWQTDTASCGSGFDGYDPYLPSFWPARVPNQVLTKKNYDIVMDHKRPLGERLAAFAQRSDWVRSLPSRYIDAINKMVTDFGHMGIVEKYPGPGDPEFPVVMEVESLASCIHPDTYASREYSRTERLLEQGRTEKVRRFKTDPKLR